ncbi:hypothetical protein ABK923_15355 [Enterobacter hormaechei]|uniref:hypothetical protein n=1 Tax=Enterobacter hormaechei TaxID=158836 RepID=UPI002066FE4E|nr:MAG TPA: hypothetical protein [Caudoviricetes sp.]
MALDHGMLNVPLDKRGNFHKELDDHLASEQKRKKKQFQDAKFLNEQARKEAWKAYEQIDEALLFAEANRRGMKMRELREVIRGLCNDRPKAALKVLEMFVKVA